MTNVTKNVETVFSIKDSTQSALGALASAFSGVGNTIGSAVGMLTPFRAALGGLGIGAAVAGITHVGGEFEQLQIGMAQTMRFMGAGGKNFEQAMSNAELMLKRIRADAGPLPGEAEDYAKALQLAGATTQKATGNFESSYQLVKDMSAIAISIGGSAELGAVEINRMLNGGKGMMHMQSDFSIKILQAMRQLPGYANLTSHEFNKMALPKRLELLQKMTRQFDDMVGAQTKTWDAVKGAATSTFKIIFAGASAPLFDAAKKGLGALNSLFVDTKGELTDFGQGIVNAGRNISIGILAGFSKVREVVVDIAGLVANIGKSNVFGKLTSIGINIAQKATSDTFGGTGGGVGIAAAALAALSGAALPLVPVFGIIGSALYELSGNTKFITSLFEGLAGLLNSFVQVVGPISDFFQTFGGLLADFVSAVLPPFISMVVSVTEPLMHFAAGLLTIATTVYSALRPALMNLWHAVGGLFESIGNFLNPVVRLLGSGFLWLYDAYTKFLIPVVNEVVMIFTALIEGVKSFLNVLGGWLTKFADKVDAASGEMSSAGKHAVVDQTGGIKEMWANLFKGPEGTKGKEMFGGNAGAGPVTPSSVGGGGRTVQDFRYSRFDITQKFAEGFDPDRIAVAFAQDIGRLGSERLQSSHEPMYAVR